MKNLHPKVEINKGTESVQPKGDKKLKCEQCPYSSAKSELIKQHIQEVHDKIRKHICEESGYVAPHKSKSKRHIEGVHENLRNHVCVECGYAAKEKAKLKIHIGAVHENLLTWWRRLMT